MQIIDMPCPEDLLMVTSTSDAVFLCSKCYPQRLLRAQNIIASSWQIFAVGQLR